MKKLRERKGPLSFVNCFKIVDALARGTCNYYYASMPKDKMQVYAFIVTLWFIYLLLFKTRISYPSFSASNSFNTT